MKLFAAHDLIRLAITAAGVLSLLLFLVAMWEQRHQLHTEAVVEERIDTAYGKTNVRATIYYQHTNGRRYGVDLPAGFKVGDTVRVIYDPIYPKSAEVETFKGIWGLPLLFAFAGAVLTAFGLFSGKKPRVPLNGAE